MRFQSIALIAVLLTVLLVVSGCIQGNSLLPAFEKKTLVVNDLNKANLNPIKIGDTVQVQYTGKLLDGTTFDSSVGRDPLEFTVGNGQLIKGFDDGVIGMKVGESKTITLPPEQAYGQPDPTRIQEVDANQLTSQGIVPEVGMQLSAGGNPVVVEKIEGDKVFVNFNHPLAGKTLVFEIKILNVKSV